jgi:hypothetical protein
LHNGPEVVERGEEHRQRNQWLNDRRRNRDEPKARQRERDGVRDRERRSNPGDLNERRAKIPTRLPRAVCPRLHCRKHQSDQEQQVIEPTKDVGDPLRQQTCQVGRPAALHERHQAMAARSQQDRAACGSAHQRSMRGIDSLEQVVIDRECGRRSDAVKWGRRSTKPLSPLALSGA